MSETKIGSSNPDSLISASAAGAVELDESGLDQVIGAGTNTTFQDVTQNKQKGALKSAEANDAYLRS